MLRMISWLIMLLIPCGIVLQIYLSMKKDKRFGLLLPLAFFTLALLAIMGFGLFAFDSGNMWSTLIIIFLVINQPTIVLLIVYAICRIVLRSRTQRTQKDELTKMNVQDLE